jgi:hypothetical protein
MTELVVRFTKDFSFFDQRSIAHQWRSWRAGNVVSDPKDIEWLTKLDAPVELIEQSEHGESQ